MPNLLLTENEYQDLIKRLDQIDKKISAKQISVDTIIYDNADLVKLLKISVRTLISWRAEGKIDFSQVNSKIFYTKKNLDDFLQKHYKPSFFREK